MKTLNDLFEQYNVPVDESGWSSIANDATVKRYNRARRLRRAAFYGSATVAAVALVITAITLTRSHSEQTPRPNAETTQVASPNTQPPTSTTTATPTTVANPTPAAGNMANSNLISAKSPQNPAISSETKTEANPVPTPTPTLNPSPKFSNTTLNPIQPVSTPTTPIVPTQTATPAETQSTIEEPMVLRADQDTLHPQQPQTAEKLFFAPNAFSPNGDGVNDLFLVYANIEYTDFELNIYSRNGDHVFHSRHIENGWNGHRNGTGELLPQGIYVYTIKYKTVNQKSGVEKGQILLIR